MDGWWGMPSSSVNQPHREICQQAHCPTHNKAADKVACLLVLWCFNVAPLAEFVYKLTHSIIPIKRTAMSNIANIANIILSCVLELILIA